MAIRKSEAQWRERRRAQCRRWFAPGVTVVVATVAVVVAVAVVDVSELRFPQPLDGAAETEAAETAEVSGTADGDGVLPDGDDGGGGDGVLPDGDGDGGGVASPTVESWDGGPYPADGPVQHRMAVPLAGGRPQLLTVDVGSGEAQVDVPELPLGVRVLVDGVPVQGVPVWVGVSRQLRVELRPDVGVDAVVWVEVLAPPLDTRTNTR